MLHSYTEIMGHQWRIKSRQRPGRKAPLISAKTFWLYYPDNWKKIKISEHEADMQEGIVEICGFKSANGVWIASG